MKSSHLPSPYMQISERFQIKKLASDTAKGTFDIKMKNKEL